MKQVLVIISLLLIFACKSDFTSRVAAVVKPLNSNIRQPIILIGGLMSSPKTWSNGDDGGLMNYLRTYSDLVYGGTLVTDHNKKVSHLNRQEGKVDFFVTGFYDSTREIDALTLELEQFIKYVLDYTNAPFVTLVGHSMGGVVARNYVVKNYDNHHVESIITLSSPHGGSYFANLLYGGGLILGDEKERIFEFLELRTGLNWKSLAVSDLIDSGPECYLTKLNSKLHPTDVNYFSIIASAKFLAIIEPMLEQFDDFIPGNTNGDWVVSLESQNMDYVKAFQITGEKPRVLGSFQVDDATHFSIKHKYEILASIIESFIERVN